MKNRILGMIMLAMVLPLSVCAQGNQKQKKREAIGKCRTDRYVE